MSDDDSIPLIGAASTTIRDNDLRGGGGDGPRVSIDRLREQIAKMAKIVAGPEFEAGADKPGGFAIEEIKLTAEISAKGELGFLVAGLEAEAKGAIELTFRRRT